MLIQTNIQSIVESKRKAGQDVQGMSDKQDTHDLKSVCFSRPGPINHQLTHTHTHTRTRQLNENKGTGSYIKDEGFTACFVRFLVS